MRAARVAAALALGFSLLGLSADAYSRGVHGFSRRYCHQACRPAVQDCVYSGMHRKTCQKAYWQMCGLFGPTTCGQSTTTTLPATTTTTLPTTPPAQGAIHLSIQDGFRFQDWGSMFCSFGIVITGTDNTPVRLDPSYFYVMSSTGVRYDALPVGMGGMMGSMMHYCSARYVVPLGGQVFCSLQFAVPYWMTDGVLGFDGDGFHDQVPFQF